MIKNIGIDVRLINQTGVGTYIRNLLYYLNHTLQETDQIHFHIYLFKKDFGSLNLHRNYFTLHETRVRWHTLDEQFSFLRQLSNAHLDLIHFTYFSYPFLYKKKFIATVHDITPLLFKTGKASTKNPLLYELKFQAFSYILSSQINNATRLITPTKTVKQQIISRFGNSFANKIHPLYEGVDFALSQAGSNMKLKETLPNDFLLYVGNFYPHKNVENLIRAYAAIPTNTKLLLVGPGDFFAPRMRSIINSLNQKTRIILFEAQTKEDFVYLYTHARALVHPSLSEGFGLPIVEAMYFNLPIIGSDIEVFRELMDDRYIKFDPRNISDISEKINSFLSGRINSHSDYDKLLSRYSFEKMANETLALYKKVLD